MHCRDVSRDDGGMYQCIAGNEEEESQGAAQLVLGGERELLLYMEMTAVIKETVTKLFPSSVFTRWANSLYWWRGPFRVWGPNFSITLEAWSLEGEKCRTWQICRKCWQNFRIFSCWQKYKLKTKYFLYLKLIANIMLQLLNIGNIWGVTRQMLSQLL